MSQVKQMPKIKVFQNSKEFEVLNTIMVQIKNVQVQNVEGLQDDSTERTNKQAAVDGFTNEVGSITLDGLERGITADSYYHTMQTQNPMSSQSG